MKTKIKIIIPDGVVVKQRVEKTTESGVIVPDEALRGGSMERFEGEVIAIGSEVTKVRPGQFVSFGRNSFSIKKWNGVECFYLYQDAIHTVHEDVADDYECDIDEFIL